MTVRVVYDDRWGSILVRSRERIVELRWYDSSAHMSARAFQSFLRTFAIQVEKHPKRGVLVDATSFKMNPRNMNGAWRDANIIPRYNRARVPKFAFHMPAGVPMIGSQPAPEGPGTFPTGYFGTREDALAWLASKRHRGATS